MSINIEKEIEKLDWNINPRELYEPIEYTLASGGKRIRPQLVLMACNLFGNNEKDTIHAALAIEIFHNFTLLHDDVMDNAEVRRGRPTVHIKWDANAAILSGDAMMIKAYEQLEQLPKEQWNKIFPLFTKMALEICEGQQYDMNFESREDVSLNEYIEMIRLKTAVLLATALKIGALIGGANEQNANYLYNYGIHLGLAFQLRDDYLDTFGNEQTFGKRIGGDILCGKKTFLLINALQKADEHKRNELVDLLHNKQIGESEKISRVTEIYQQLEIEKVCEDAINSRYQQAIAELGKISVKNEKKQIFVELAEKLMGRNV